MYLDRFKLAGRVAVVTGGAQAIGLACVEALSEAGAHVIIADRDPKAAAEGQAAMGAKGYAVDFIEIDVTNSAQVDAAAARVMREKGRVDILVCNAGIARSETRPRTWRTSIGSMSSTSISTASSGVAAPSASRCWRPGAARSSTSARCPASSSTSRSRNPITTPPRRACIT